MYFLLQLDVYEPVIRYVHEILTNKSSDRSYKHNNKYTNWYAGDNWTMSVTGHSLGGAIATIVGSTLGIPVQSLDVA